MTYEYYCDKCNDKWDESHTIEDRDLPVGNDCPCAEGGFIKRGVCAPAISFAGVVSPIRRAGSGWNDVLKGIKKASGKENTIDHY